MLHVTRSLPPKPTRPTPPVPDDLLPLTALNVADASKVMPAKTSQYWREGWDQNCVEATALEKLRSVAFAPVVFDHFTYEFTNKWCQDDAMDVLIVSKLGQDLQTAACTVPLDAYCKAYVLAGELVKATNTTRQKDSR